ncbi:probable chitinase 2, partial [Anopheles aquasalis]|uniref:probable chitinase 2 n=1 Tax=Anopheles aquasalis TaxID=42839 RepID=UPI00215ADE8B
NAGSGRGEFIMSDIDAKLCDYLLYAFFGIDGSGKVEILDPSLDLEDNGGRGYIRRFNELKSVNRSLKTLASIGGDKIGMKESFSLVAASSSLRSTFASNARRFCQKHGFDGVDIDWEFPEPVDRSNFIQFLAALSSELHDAGLILTVAVGASEFQASKAYDIAGIARYIDFINLMTYDYNGHRDGFTGHNAPLFTGPADRTDHQQMLNIDHSVKYWLHEGAPSDKLILGVPAYGRTFRLANTRDNDPRDKAIGPGGGVMMWTIDMDDFDGNFGCKYPLLNVINEVLKPGLLISLGNTLIRILGSGGAGDSGSMY